MDAGSAATAKGAAPFPWARASLLALVGWWTLSMGAGYSTWCAPDYVNLPFHEAGHVFLAGFGDTVGRLGGTIGQLAVPALLVVYFFWRRDDAFAAAVCLWWAGENLVNISIYMADARELALPLVGGGDHDWNELFFRFGVLTEPAVSNISGATRAAGTLVMLVGGAWAVRRLLSERAASSAA